MIAFCWPGSSVIHFAAAETAVPGCIELAHGDLPTVARAVYQLSDWDGTYFDIPGMAAALAAEDYLLADQRRDEYGAKLRARIAELSASAALVAA
jgi:hypothetical protein